jgi:RNA polymerase sigma-70 factor (ECF subfamily)
VKINDFVKRLKSGDTNAFAELVIKYQTEIRNVIWRQIGDERLSEDATQEVFIRAHKSIKSFREESGIKTWLMSIAYNVSMNYLAKKK